MAARFDNATSINIARQNSKSPLRRRRFKTYVQTSAESFLPCQRFRAFTLAAADVLAVALSVTLAAFVSAWIRSSTGLPEFTLQTLYASAIVTSVIPLATMLWFSLKWSHYTRIKAFWTETHDILKIQLYAVAIVGALSFASNTHFSRLLIASFFSAMIVVAPLTRYLIKLWLRKINRWFVPLIIVGDATGAGNAAHAIASDVTLGYKIAVRVFFDDISSMQDSDLVRELKPLLNDLAASYPEARLLLAVDRHDNLEKQQILADLAVNGFEQIIVSRPMHGLSAANAEILYLDKYDTLFIRLTSGGIGRWRGMLKRSIDILISITALLILAPVFAVLGLIVRSDGGQALYGSKRIGLGGKIFTCYKFRSMCLNSEEVLNELLDEDAALCAEWRRTFKLENDPRITRMGAVLRRTSLDELPQLWNVLNGEMSLVGPRPILPDELEDYGPRILQYKGVRPGVTGLWQISGRSNLGYDERVALNFWYVRNWSLWLDFTILLRTVLVLFNTQDAK